MLSNELNMIILRCP